MTTPKQRPLLGGILATSVAVFILVLLLSIPPLVKAVALTGIAIGWTIAASRWAIRRFGRRAAIVELTMLLVAVSTSCRAWWLDRPNRQLLTQIEAIPGLAAVSDGTFFVGNVYRVYIGPKATDADVRRFTELAGLDAMRSILVYKTKISDDTARRFGRFKSLSSLTFQGIDVSEDVLEELDRQLPQCHVEVIDA